MGPAPDDEQHPTEPLLPRGDPARAIYLQVIDQDFLAKQGDARILVAIVKSVEDRRNVSHDTSVAGVPVVLVVEDNKHVAQLITEGLRIAALAASGSAAAIAS